MNEPHLTFQVCIRDAASIAEVGARIAQVLNCRFEPADEDEMEGEEALEAQVLGLELTLYYWPQPSKGSLRNYWLTGLFAQDDDLSWDGEVIDISRSILGLLQKGDSSGWYIADQAELERARKMIPDDLTP